jgi:hypothetical protein
MSNRSRCALILFTASLCWSSGASAALEIRKSSVDETQVRTAEFDPSKYSVWVDNTYEALVEYGIANDVLQDAATYGEPMPLADALKILVPDRWKVMRSNDLTKKGRQMVSWDLVNGNWIDVLRNLGERHGLQFHVDFGKNHIFIKNGRQLIFNRAENLGIYDKNPIDAPVQSSEPTVKTQTARTGTAQAPTVSSMPAAPAMLSRVSGGGGNARLVNAEEGTFTVNKGDNAQWITSDMALMFGYDRSHWIAPQQTAYKTQTFTGNPLEIIAGVMRLFDTRMCLYDGDFTAATVPSSMECPK